MPSLEDLSAKCLAVCQVPVHLSKDIIFSHVQKHLQKGKIIDLDQVDGIETNRALTRVVLLCTSVEDVNHICQNVKQEEIQHGGDYIVVKYQKAIACELPERWERIEIPDADENEHESSAGSSQPQPPPRHPEHSKPTGRDQQYQQQQFQYPVGPYGAMSGFYQNIPHSTAESMQRGGPMPSQAQGQAQGHAHGHAQGQPPMQGHEQRHRHPQGFSDQNIGQGQHQNFPFGPGQFPLGPNMFGRPPFPYDPQNAKGGQRMPFPPGMPMPMPMFIDPKTGQLVYQYPPQFANVPPEQAGQGGVPMEHHQQHPRGPPPPYNHWNVKGQGPLGQSQAIADQAEMIQKLQAKADTEKQTLQAEKEEDPRPESDVEEQARSDEEPETEEKPTKIVVSNLPSTVHDEYLEMFFENKRKFGGVAVFNVDIDEESNTAVVEFEQPESVDIVLEKLPLKMMGKEVDVEVYTPAPPVPFCTIEVTGPCSIVCKDQLETLEMYFDNTRRSGGDTVVDCVFDEENNMVLVTFETEEVAQRVEERGNHKIKKEILKVTLHVPGKKTESKNKTEEKEEQEEETENETETPKTIKVKGVDKSASRDTVEYYFENTKRSGGGEIEKMYSDEEDEDVLYITFVNEKYAANVVERESHHVDGKELSVSLYVPPVPPPSYNDKIIIKGLKSSTTQDCLFNFIEAKTGFIPETMDYHSELEDVVMVTFSDNPDFQKLESVFGKSKLEGASLKISPVPISNCIIVADLASEVTKDTVEFYFENTRKSGGGAVEKVVMNEDDSCLVYFEDYTIIDRILEKTHKLSGQKLEVKRYQECLGKPEGESGERKLQLPDDLVLDADPQKIKFMKHSAANRSALEKQLDVCYAKINWPAEGDQVILTCRLTKEVKDCFKLVKKWKETAKQNFRDFMKLILVKKVPVLQNIWVKVMEELQKVNIDNPDAVAIFVDKKENAITVVGNQHVAESLSKKIDDITKSVMEEAAKEREKIKEVFTALKPLETRMLLADKFPNEMEQRFTDLKVKINQNKNEIVFEGPLGQVRDAKLKMYEMKSKFAQARADKITEFSAGMFGLKQVKDYIVKKLKASKLTAVWDVMDSCLIVYSTSEEQIQECLGIIRESVIENTIALKKASQTVVNSEAWQSKIDELHAYKTGKCNIKVSDNFTKVHVCATDDVANEIVDSVKKFLRLNTVVEVKVPCTQNVHRLIEKHHKQELQTIAKSLQDMYVQISSVPGYGGFEVRGTEDGIQKAKDRLSLLLGRVQKHEHIIKKPGLATHMQTPKGKDNLNTIESNLECVVAVKGDDYVEESDDNPYETLPVESGVSENIHVDGVKILGYCKAYDCRNIYTVEGDMTELKVDMLVNSADEKLSLTGGLGKAVVRKGGKQIQNECAAYIKSEGKLLDGEAFVSTGGNLKASCIIHVRGPVWKGGMKQEDEMLEEAVLKCLQQASTRSLVSVAIPAISCGTYGYPVKKATSTIVQAVKNFFREVQDSTVTDVYLIDMKLNTVEAFNECLSREFGASNFKKYEIKDKRRPRSTASDYDEDVIRPIDTDEEDDDYYTSSSNMAPPRGRKGPPLPKGRPPTRSLDGGSTNIGHIAVSVVKGEIAKQKVDVIVNTTAKNLDLKNGAVSASLLKAGGAQLQQEVSQKYPNGIKDGEIAVTTGQNLKCDVVIHSSMANWDGKNDAMCKGALHKLMKDCLNEAEKQNKTSIAFPAIGTGNLGFPKDVVASEMFSAVSKFAESNSQSSVKDVRFIVYQKDFKTIQAFEDEAKRWATGKRGGRQTRKFDVYEDLQQGRGRVKENTSDDDDNEHVYERIPADKRSDDDDDDDDDDSGVYKFGSITVTVQQGDITAEKADCIVNSSNEALDLSRGAVSQALMKIGGKELAKEIDKLKKKMKNQGMVITSAPGLKCHHIIHVVAKDTIPEWKDIVENCLLAAEQNRMTSIAFPALGTGIQLNASDVAETIMEAILKFEKSNPTHVKDVKLVIYQKSMVEDFKRAIQKTLKPKSGSFIGKVFKKASDWLSGKDADDYQTYETRKGKKKSKKQTDPNTVTFIFLALKKDIIDQAIKRLDGLLNKEIHTKDFSDSIIKKMDENQMMEIQAIARQYHLDMELQSTSGRIQISGIASNVMSASDKIHRIMRDAVSMEQAKNSAALMSNLVQWSYIEVGETGQNLQPYDQNLNYKIETAYLDKALNVKFSANKTKYVLDFDKMEEYPEDDPKDVVTVLRRDLVNQGAFEQPTNWSDMTGNLRVVVVPNSSQEFNDISQKFVASAMAPFTVVKIERVQNKTLWSQYQAKKKQLDDQNPASTTNEKLLWHGTSADTVDNINAHGFNRSYCGKNATVFGDGVYFAVNAQYSCSNTYSRPDAGGIKRMYYCRVLTGEFTQGAKGMRVPPKKGGASSTALFDSVADRQASPGMFIIFHDTQAYPEYLVSFKQ